MKWHLEKEKAERLLTRAEWEAESIIRQAEAEAEDAG